MNYFTSAIARAIVLWRCINCDATKRAGQFRIWLVFCHRCCVMCVPNVYRLAGQTR